MPGCIAFKEEMLIDPIHVHLEDATRGYHLARKAADEMAATRGQEPMLLAWFDRARGEFSPRVE